MSLLVAGRSPQVRARASVCALLLLAACSSRHLSGRGPNDDDTDDDSALVGDGGVRGRGADGGRKAADGTSCDDDDVDPPTPACEDYTVEVQNALANVLVVLDRSGSMRDLTVNRWDPSIKAVEDLTASLPKSLQLGLMTFPGDCNALPTLAEQADCVARQGGLTDFLTCEPGQLKVKPGMGTAAAISTQLHGMSPTGATPTAATLKVAHQALKDMATATSTQSVLLVTDGAPNCFAGNVGGLGSVGLGSASGQPEAVPPTVAAIDAMTKDGIKTYVLGYDTQTDPTLKAALDSMAAAGGTGATAHTPVGSHETLRDALKNLASVTADCELVLKSKVVDPWKVQVTLDGKVLTVDDPNGYSLDAAGDNLTLRGAACDTVRADSAKHALRVAAVCPPPAPKPPKTPKPPKPPVMTTPDPTPDPTPTRDPDAPPPEQPVVLGTGTGCDDDIDVPAEPTPPDAAVEPPTPTLY